MKKEIIKKAMPIVADAFGRKYGVRIAIGGDQAYTTEGTIVIPTSAESEDPEVLWGYLAHEAAHLRYSDFTLSISPPLRQALTNVLEDIRVELAIRVPFPGTRLFILKAIEVMKTRGEIGFFPPPPDRKVHPAAVLHDYILCRLRSDLLGQKVLAEDADRAEKAMRELFPKGAMARLNGLLSKVPDLMSSREALALADQILRMIQEELDRQDEDKAGAGRRSDPNSWGSSSDSESDSDRESGNLDLADSSGENGEAAGSAAGKLAFCDLIQAGQEVFQDPFQKVRERMSAVAAGNSEWTFPIAKEIQGKPDPARIASLKRRTTKLRTSLQGMVQASQMRRIRPVSMGLRIDPARLAGTVVGDCRVFRRQLPKPAPNTAVHILLDRSGSMAYRIWQASDAVLALALALDGIPGVNPAVTAFPGSNNREVCVLHRHGGGSVEKSASAFEIAASGGTPLHTALMYACAAVMACREERKVVMVITDGDPDDATKVLDAIRLCERFGIEVYGIGIGVDVKHLFGQATSIQSVEELAVRIFDLSRDFLLGRVGQGRCLPDERKRQSK